MDKPLFPVIFAVLAGAILFEAVRPHGAEATVPPAAQQTPQVAAPVEALPAIQEPFDMTPITPVESTGAPMFE